MKSALNGFQFTPSSQKKLKSLGSGARSTNLLAMLNYLIVSAKNIFAFFSIVLNLGGSLIFSYSRASLFSYRDV